MEISRREMLIGLASSLSFLSTSQMDDFNQLDINLFYEAYVYHDIQEEDNNIFEKIENSLGRSLKTLEPVDEVNINHYPINEVFSSKHYYSDFKYWMAVANMEFIKENMNEKEYGNSCKINDFRGISNLAKHSNILITGRKITNYEGKDLRGTASIDSFYCPSFWCHFGIVGNGYNFSKIEDFNKYYYHRNDNGAILATLAHEVGHNLGLRHKDGEQYQMGGNIYSSIMAKGYGIDFNNSTVHSNEEYVEMRFNSDIQAKNIIL